MDLTFFKTRVILLPANPFPSFSLCLALLQIFFVYSKHRFLLTQFLTSIVHQCFHLNTYNARQTFHLNHPPKNKPYKLPPSHAHLTLQKQQMTQKSNKTSRKSEPQMEPKGRELHPNSSPLFTLENKIDPLHHP